MPGAFPGYVLPNQFPVDAGVLYVGSTPVGMGATKGGLKWDPAEEWQHVEYDGKSSESEGLHRVVDYSKNKLSGQILDLTGVAIGRYSPGSTSDGSTGTNTITPIDAFVFLSTGAYLANVTWFIRRSNNSTLIVVMPFALIKKYTLDTKPKVEGTASIELTAVQPQNPADLAACPYFYKDSSN